LKAFLRFENGRPTWYYDRDDPDENAIVSRLRRNVILTDSQGGVMETFGPLDSVDVKIFDVALQNVRQTGTNVETMTYDRSGAPFLLLCGQLRDERGPRQYYAFLRRPMVGNRIWFLLTFLAAGLSFALSALMVRHCYGRRNELPAREIVS
jgi:hypothetical protein